MLHRMMRVGLKALTIAALGATSAAADVNLVQLGRYATGVFDDTAAEIPAYDAASKRAMVTNSSDNTADLLDLSDPQNITLIRQVDLSPWGDGPNGVASQGGVFVVGVQADPKTDPGMAVFLDANGDFISAVRVGSLPDMVAFTPDGRYVLVANEGEPNDDYDIDPEGTVSAIDLSVGVENLTDDDVTRIDFTAFNGQELPGVRIFGPNATVAQDIEPEYIAVSADSKTAWVTLQENNAVGIIDIDTLTVTDVVALGTINHKKKKYAIDASDDDGMINIARWKVRGMFLPDAIASYTIGRKTYWVTANEGDARDYDGYAEEERISDLDLDPAAFPKAAKWQLDENLGRLNVTLAQGDEDGDLKYETLYSFGTRSFSIWNKRGKRVFDSGSQFETIIAGAFPDDFNSDNTENDTFDNRSDNKGPEPEAVTVAQLDGRSYAFIGLERMGGIMVYDVTNPKSPEFLQYVTNRDFDGDPENGTAGDLGPEGMVVVSAEDSPIGAPLLIVANEISGTTTAYRIDVTRP